MERGGNFQQGCADQKKEKPRDQNSERELHEAENFGEGEPLRERPTRQFFQAGGAKDAIVVFGDALAAEVLCALRAAGDSLAPGMVETTLMDGG